MAGRSNRASSPSLLDQEVYLARYLRRFTNPPPPPIITNWSTHHTRQEEDDDVQFITEVPISKDTKRVPGHFSSEPSTSSTGNYPPEPVSMYSIEQALAEMEGDDESSVLGSVEESRLLSQGELIPPQSPSPSIRRMEESLELRLQRTNECSSIDEGLKTYFENLCPETTVGKQASSSGSRIGGVANIKPRRSVTEVKRLFSEDRGQVVATTLNETASGSQFSSGPSTCDNTRPNIIACYPKSVNAMESDCKDGFEKKSAVGCSGNERSQVGQSTSSSFLSFPERPVVKLQSVPNSPIDNQGRTINPDFLQNDATQKTRHYEPHPREQEANRLSAAERLSLVTTCLSSGCPQYSSVMSREEARKHLARAHNLKQCDVCLLALSNKGTTHKSHFLQEHGHNFKETACCPLCNLHFKYEGFYQHMARAHYIPEEERERRIKRPTSKDHSSGNSKKSRTSSEDDPRSTRGNSRHPFNSRSGSSSSSSTSRGSSLTYRSASSGRSRNVPTKTRPRSTTTLPLVENQRKPETLIPLGRPIRDIEKAFAALSGSLKNYRIPRSSS